MSSSKKDSTKKTGSKDLDFKPKEPVEQIKKEAAEDLDLDLDLDLQEKIDTNQSNKSKNNDEVKGEQPSGPFSREAIIASIVVVLLVLGGLLFMVTNQFTVSQPAVEETEYGLQIDFEKLEIADENPERLRGFMFREEICDDCGMLFIFPDSQVRAFWMKDVTVPLDIIFMDESGKIIKIHENTETENVDLRYSSEEPSRYVLEAKTGFVGRAGLEEGELVDIEHMRGQGVNFVWISID